MASFGFALLIISGTILRQGQVEYTFGIILMVSSLLLLIKSLGTQWTSSLGVMHVLMLLMYHGVSTLFYGLFPLYADYFIDARVDIQDLASATLIASIGIFSFTLGYTFSQHYHQAADRRKQRLPFEKMQAAQLSSLSTPFLYIFVGLIVIFNAGGLVSLASNDNARYWLTSFFSYLLVPMIVLYMLNLAVRIGEGRIPRVIVVAQICLLVTLILLFGGERQAMLTAVISLFFLGAKWQVLRITRSLLISGTAGLLALFFIVAIARGVVGRAALRDNSFDERLSAYQSINNENLSEGIQTLLYDLNYRLNGNVIIANISNSRIYADHKLRLEHYIAPLNLIIPSALWGNKLALPRYMRSLEYYLVVKLELADIDYLTTDLAVFYASGNLPFLICMMIFLGSFVAFLDRWLERSKSLFGVIVGVCAAIALAWVERDVTIWALSFRNVIIIYFIFAGTRFIQSILSGRRFMPS